ncbi:hypothetical protein [Glutamicibacter sp. X7]
MSFVFGGVNSGSLAGVTATLTAWPSLGGLALDAVDLPRGGRFFAQIRQTHSTFVFDVIIQGPTPTETAMRRDNFVGMIDPSVGPRDLVVETDQDWKFPDVVVSGQVDWSRMGWQRDIGFTFRAEVTFETTSKPHAVEVAPEVSAFVDNVTFTPTRGNTSCFPRVEFPAGEETLVKIGTWQVVVAKPRTASGTAVLDYSTWDFYIHDGSGNKVESLVPHMSHFDRPVLRQGVPVVVSCAGAPTGTRRLYPNYCRI